MARAERSGSGPGRTPSDLSVLCVELLRAVREREFLARRPGASPGASSTGDASQGRAWRAWRSDLDRHGALHLLVGDRCLQEAGSPTPVGRGRLEDLVARLGERGVSEVVFEEAIDAASWSAFVNLLIAPADDVAGHGGAAAFLPETCRGIRLVGPVAEEAPAPSEEEKPEPATAPAPPSEPAVDDAGLLAALHALDACEHDAEHASLVRRVTDLAAEASETGDGDGCYRAILMLSDQSRSGSSRSEAMQHAALEGLRQLVSGRRLADLLERACEQDHDASLRASQVLLQIAEHAAPALLQAIDSQQDVSRRDQLLGIAIALGRTATPELRRAMSSSSPTRARTAARVAGEIQDGRAVPALEKLLDHDDTETRQEAARALARIGDRAALEALVRGLESPHEDLSALCAYCLGVTGREEATGALTDTLRRARRARRIGLASAVIRSLGQLGREEAVTELRRVLEKKSLFRRRENHELKLQAVAALAKMPGESAQAALRAAASGPDMSLAVAARRAFTESPED